MIIKDEKRREKDRRRRKQKSKEGTIGKKEGEMEGRGRRLKWEEVMVEAR